VKDNTNSFRNFPVEQTHEKIPIPHVRFLSDFGVNLRPAYG
jgi:hypothetical protein